MMAEYDYRAPRADAPVSVGCNKLEAQEVIATNQTLAFPDVEHDDKPHRKLSTFAVTENSSRGQQISGPLRNIDQLFDSSSSFYGRDREKKILLEAFHRRIMPPSSASSPPLSSSTTEKEIVLITGHSGTGKTALANTLRGPVHDVGGYVISGKFDQLQQSDPYATFVTAFTQHSNIVISKGEEFILSTKRRILDKVGSEISLVVDMIPALERIVGISSNNKKSKESVVVPGNQRHNDAFCSFVSAICSCQCPLVLILDDIQWSDASSVDLLEGLIRNEAIEGLLIVGTCRHNEISSDHELSGMLRVLENDRLVSIKEIFLLDLSYDDTSVFLTRILKQHAPESCINMSSGNFARIVYEETGGNTFFILQFLISLYEKGALYRDDKNKSQWHMDEATMRTIGNGKGVVELLSHKILRLPIETQEMLMVASCIGAVFDEYLLFEALPFTNVDEVMASAVRSGIIVAEDGGQHGEYKFAHDKTQQAAYSMIPESERNAFHLNIGRRLRENLPSEELDINIYIVVNQLSWGLPLIKDQQEKNEVASLCLKAGEKAALASDYGTATSYLQFGISLLDDNHWRDQYFLSLDLFNTAIEMEFCNSSFDEVDELIETVLSNARILRDKIRAYTIQLNAFAARKKFDAAIDIGLEVLASLGERFPSSFHKLCLINNLIKTKKMLKKKTNGDLLRLRDMHEWDKIAAMQILNILIPYFYQVKENLVVPASLRMIQLTLENGMSYMSSPGFAVYGAIICSLGNMDEGHRYGELALQILNKGNIEAWLPRVYFLYYTYVSVWKSPLRTSLGPLFHAHEVGLRVGDREMSMRCARFHAAVSFYSGRPLGLIYTELVEYCKLMKLHKQESILLTAKTEQQRILNFMGQSENPVVLTGEKLDEDSFIQDARQNNNQGALSMFYIYKLILAYYFNDYELAFEVGLLNMRVKLGIERGIHSFFNGLSCLALAHCTRKKKKYIVIAKREMKKVKKLAMNCPCNFKNKFLLMEAEFALLHNDIDIALPKYDESIMQAESGGFLHEHALACERAGLAIIQSGDKPRGLTYLSRACSLYTEWGAHAKVEDVQRKILSISTLA